jgi:uncharacterized protein (DUF2344 family)
MQISFLPALALGMQGREEVIEFRSRYLFDSHKFILHVNSYLPAGVKAIRIEKVAQKRPSLSKDIASMVYSFDLKHRDVRTALKEQTRLKNLSDENVFEFVKKSLKKESLNTLSNVYLDKKEKIIRLEFIFSPSKAIGLKSIIEKSLGIECPNFALAREEIKFKSS